MRVDVVLPAAGSSVRMKLPVAKQFQEVCGHPVLAYTIDCFHRLPWIRHIIVVVDMSQVSHTRFLLEKYGFEKMRICTGGETRHRSIFCGIQALKNDCQASDVVVIHDAARPFVPEETISRVATAAQGNKVAGVTRPLVSTVIRGDESGSLVESLVRHIYRNSEMPQAFHYGVIADAYSKCTEYDFDFGTECLLLALKYAGCAAHLVDGTEDLWKVTYQKDLYAMESLVKEKFTILSIINKATTRSDSTFLSDVESKIFGSTLKVATQGKCPANTFIVFIDLWPEAQSKSLDLESTVSHVADSCKSGQSVSKICLKPFVIVVFVSGTDVTGNNSKQGEKCVGHTIGSKRQRGKQGEINNSEELFNSSCPSQSDSQVIGPYSSLSSLALSVELSTPNAGKCPKLDSAPPCKETVSTFSSNDHLMKNVGSTVSLATNLVPADSKPDVESAESSHRHRDTCSSVLTSLRTNCTKSLGEKSSIVFGIMVKASGETTDRLLSLLWHRASYLDGQLLDWT